MGMFNSMNISSSGLTAERLRLDIISKNIANANTTRTANGMPYRRQTVVFKEVNQKSFKDMLSDAMEGKTKGGVEVAEIVEDKSPFKKVYNPGHPDADKEGYVSMPNVNTVSEMVNMISATRSYEANVTAINASKSMLNKALEIGR